MFCFFFAVNCCRCSKYELQHKFNNSPLNNFDNLFKFIFIKFKTSCITVLKILIFFSNIQFCIILLNATILCSKSLIISKFKNVFFFFLPNFFCTNKTEHLESVSIWFYTYLLSRFFFHSDLLKESLLINLELFKLPFYF